MNAHTVPTTNDTQDADTMIYVIKDGEQMATMAKTFDAATYWSDSVLEWSKVKTPLFCDHAQSMGQMKHCLPKLTHIEGDQYQAEALGVTITGTVENLAMAVMAGSLSMLMNLHIAGGKQ